MTRDRAMWTRRHLLQSSLALTGLGLLSGCGLRMPGQQVTKVRRIGFLGVGSREGRAFLIEGLLEGLREHGYAVGENIVIDYRFSEDRDDRLPALAAEFVNLNVDVIVASANLAVVAAKQATRSIPIVMGGSSEPVASGIVASLAQPGANVTGLSLMSWQLIGKRLELLKALIPDLAMVAMFTNINNPGYVPQVDALEAAARTFEIQVLRLDVRRAEDLEIGFKAAATRHADALLVPADALTTNNRVTVAGLAKQYRQPAIYEQREFVEAGGLMCYGANLPDLYRRAAAYVDKILKGANPADLPIEQPTKFDFAINLKTAQALGITIPQSVLQQATELIQ